MADVQLVPPADVFLRLEIVEGLTGVPASTLREAISSKEMYAKKRRGSWHIRLEDYNAWIEQPETERRGDAGAVGERELELLHANREEEDPGQTGKDKTRGDRQPQSKAKATRTGKRPEVRIVYELGPALAEG